MDSSIQQLLPNVEDTAAVDLLPCHVCGRTFVSASLKKHEKVCEKSLVKKRKPFDSLKQRVEGTDIAPFHQKTYLRKPEPVPEPVRKPKRSSWKEKHLELLNSIRAARGITPESDHSTTPVMRSTSSFLADTERCPSCDRQFGPKAYDRHVEWCKEKTANRRIQHSPANVRLAKERLEARIKYVPPLNRARKTPVREKYSNQSPSPGKTGSTASLVSQPSIRRKAKIDSNLVKSREKILIETKRDVSRQSTVEKKNEGREEPDDDDHSARSSYDITNCSLPAITSSPKTESVKCLPCNKKRYFPQIKINKPNINSQVEGITVASITYDGISKKLVTWRDTVTSHSEDILKCDRNCGGTIRQTQSVSGVNFTNAKKNLSIIENNKKESVDQKNVSLYKNRCLNQANYNNNDPIIKKLIDVKVSSLERNNKQKYYSETDTFSDTSSFSIDLEFVNNTESQEIKLKHAKERKIKITQKIPNKKSNNHKKIVVDETKDYNRKTNNNKTNENVDETTTNDDDGNNKEKKVTDLPVLDKKPLSLALDYNWMEDPDCTGETVERQLIDVDVQGEFSYQKLLRKKHFTKPSMPNTDTSSTQITNSISNSSTTINADFSSSIPYITNTPLKCSKTNFNLNVNVSQESLISTTIEEYSSSKDDSCSVSDLKSLPKFDWSTGELPTFTKSITCFNEEFTNNFPSVTNSKLKDNNSEVNKSSLDSRLNYIDDIDKKIDSIDKNHHFSSATAKEKEAQEEISTVNDTIVLLFQSASENRDDKSFNEMSNNEIVFNNCDSDRIELEYAKSSNNFLKKSLSDIDIYNTANSKNNLISIFSRQFNDADDVESLNSKKFAMRSLPNIILHYNHESLANKIDKVKKIDYTVENLGSNVINSENRNQQVVKQKSSNTCSKEMLRRKILEVGAKEFLQDFRHNRENFGDCVLTEDYSVPKKKRKLESISSLKSQLEQKCLHKNKLSKRKNRFKKISKKDNKDIEDVSTQSEEVGDSNVSTIMLPQILLPFRSRRSQRHMKSTKTKNCEAKSSNYDSDKIDYIRQNSTQVEQVNEKRSIGIQLKLPPIISNDEKGIQVNFFERLPNCIDRNFIGSKYFLKSSASRSYSTEKIVKLERKDSLLSSKKSIKNTDRLSTNIKNDKNTRGVAKIQVEEQSKGDWFNINNNELNSELSLKPEDLFAVDDAMYEEFKKYEQLYLKGRKQKQSTKKQKPKLIEINYKILSSSDEHQSSQLNNKISTDSAYGSLTRNTPEHRNVIPNHLMLEETIIDGAELEEADKCTVPSDHLDQRMSKFCHECGNKYPVALAKFCVECGVRRLIL